MRVLVTGSTGLIGSALVSRLAQDGHRVARLVRGSSPPAGDSIRWDPEAGAIDTAALENFDAVVHLAGENIGARRWTAERKRRILESRVRGTRHLAEAINRLAAPPGCFLTASAIGYFGDRGQEILREGSPPGKGFLPEVCIQWEGAAQVAATSRTRLVCLRIGVVLSAAGGALQRMLLPFRLGLGGKIGSGKQYMSWITLHDLVEIIRHVILTDCLSGPVHAVSPNPVTNEEFTRVLGRVLSKPTLFAAPAFAVRLALGEMAQELLLASTRVVPAALQSSGFEFRYPQLEPALRHLLAHEGDRGQDG